MRPSRQRASPAETTGTVPETSRGTAMARGRFRPGHDPRRHRFTREECQRGYQAAMESLERRFPGCDAHFLMCAIIGSRPWHTLPEIRFLLERDEPLGDEEAIALFARG